MFGSKAVCCYPDCLDAISPDYYVTGDKVKPPATEMRRQASFCSPAGKWFEPKTGIRALLARFGLQ